jgi:prolyl-tRNA editing enzyme YbaK/EbsC (Cys-tRNA(Pro) deacylase)
MPLNPSAIKVQQALNAIRLQLEVIELPASTRTSQEAALAMGCQVGQIAKSIIFQTLKTHRPVLVIASGTNRVGEKVIDQLVGEQIEKTDEDFVRNHTGFVIGGVPPLGHSEPMETFIDQDLLQYSEIWAAAGTPHAVFRLAPGDLQRMSGGMVTKITE